MYTTFKPFFLLALSPVHAGSGSDLGVVDLPIQRERHTGYPKIEASGIKGVFREVYSKKLDKETLDIVFGPKEGDAHQSSVGFIDARILFFPVKSVKGTYAWITCPDVLSKFAEAMGIAGITINDTSGLIDIANIPVNTITTDSNIKISTGSGGASQDAVIIEEYPVKPVSVNNELSRFADWFGEHVLSHATTSYQREKLKKNLLLVDNEVFNQFVALSTEVIARICIDPNLGTVKPGALWYEEYLPVESILYSILMSAQPMMMDIPEKAVPLKGDAGKVMKTITDQWPQVVQLGGNATIGKGLIKPLLYFQGGDHAG